MKVAIIGAGFCGLAVAWHLLQHSPSCQICLFDSKGIGQGASGIAAGLLHPYTGAHAKLNWKGKEGVEATQALLTVASDALGQPVTANDQGILRLALENTQLIDFQNCAKNYPCDTEWLDPPTCQTLAPGCANASGLWIKKGITVFSSLYLKGLWYACAKKGVQFQQRHIHSLNEMQEFDLTIVTTGAETLQISELASLPLTLIKGQLLEFSWPRDIPPLSCALNSQVYLIMTETRTSCLVGATFEKGYQTASIDLLAAEQHILPKAFELFPPLKKASLLNCYAGMRTAAPQHRPLIYSLSPSQWVLTGMGSKGLLYHALFAKELVNKIS